MYVIGLTGMIASGKSTVSVYLRGRGMTVIDADRISHEVILRGNPAYEDIVAAFGEQYIGQDGEIDRRKLGELIFSDAEKRDRLNAIVHPRVIDEIKRRVAEAGDVAVMDVPLLIQTGLDRMCDEIWYVTAEEGLRIRRIIERDRLSKAQAKARVASQQVVLPQDRLVYQIENSGDLTRLWAQTEALIQRVEKMYEKKK